MISSDPFGGMSASAATAVESWVLNAVGPVAAGDNGSLTDRSSPVEVANLLDAVDLIGYLPVALALSDVEFGEAWHKWMRENYF